MTLNRRTFVRLSAAAAALPALGRPAWSEAHPQHPIGLQLSTLVKQKVSEQELQASLREIAKIGFQEVEPWHAAYTIPAETLRGYIRESGLTISSGHFEYADLTADVDAQLKYAKTLGLTWVVCPMLPKTQWSSAEGFRTAAHQFNDWGKRVHDMGMRFAFHNHDYEFRQFGSVTGYDILINETDPKLLAFEMDCYWVTQAGHDPVQLMNRLGQRVRMLHVKDRKPGFPSSFDMEEASSHFTEVGTGGINWPVILATAEKLHVEHYFIEQDRITGSPVDSLRTSYTNLRRMLA